MINFTNITPRNTVMDFRAGLSAQVQEFDMKIGLFSGLMLVLHLAKASCPLYYNNLPIPAGHQDAVSILLSVANTCPQSIQDFMVLMKNQSLTLHTAMVANRGRHNPRKGSFSFFSAISGQMANGFQVHKGEFYLGFFTDRIEGQLKLDQAPEEKKLLIELIAWDKAASQFNFYELRGLDQHSVRWYYRGNSQDAYLDNHYLYRRVPRDQAKFGNRMRCSACHNSGGPIMKELSPPHNDWWASSNPLPLGPNRPDAEVQDLIQNLIEADEFADLVRKGMNYLDNSEAMSEFKGRLSLQEQLRPLFCTNEINLESDQASPLAAEVNIPSAFWLNPLLGQVETSLNQQAYRSLLTRYKMQFPETQLADADHAWLTPVKGYQDLQAIRQLIEQGVVSPHFAKAVLMIDLNHPLFSRARCDLLNMLPEANKKDWEKAFTVKLWLSKDINAARLAGYLEADEAELAGLIQAYLEQIKQQMQSTQGQQQAFKQLLASRQSVYQEELSQNPRGQILEPVFRVIFPLPTVD